MNTTAGINMQYTGQLRRKSCFHVTFGAFKTAALFFAIKSLLSFLNVPGGDMHLRRKVNVL